jgi:hypothetical protein
MVVTEGWARSQTTKLKSEYSQDELPLDPAVATILLLKNAKWNPTVVEPGSIAVTQKLMRHANISTTMNVYGGAFMEAKRKANTSVVRRVLSQKQSK